MLDLTVGARLASELGGKVRDLVWGGEGVFADMEFGTYFTRTDIFGNIFFSYL